MRGIDFKLGFTCILKQEEFANFPLILTQITSNLIFISEDRRVAKFVDVDVKQICNKVTGQFLTKLGKIIDRYLSQQYNYDITNRY